MYDEILNFKELEYIRREFEFMQVNSVHDRSSPYNMCLKLAKAEVLGLDPSRVIEPHLHVPDADFVTHRVSDLIDPEQTVTVSVDGRT